MDTHQHTFEEVYNGLKCRGCDLFYPDNGNYFNPYDEAEEQEEYHSFDCICETCLQNHPERDLLYGDGTYFNYGETMEQANYSTDDLTETTHFELPEITIKEQPEPTKREKIIQAVTAKITQNGEKISPAEWRRRSKRFTHQGDLIRGKMARKK